MEGIDYCFSTRFFHHVGYILSLMKKTNECLMDVHILPGEVQAAEDLDQDHCQDQDEEEEE